MSGVNEADVCASSGRVSVKHTHLIVKESLNQFYNRPELYQQRWKEQFLAKHAKVAERFNKSDHIANDTG